MYSLALTLSMISALATATTETAANTSLPPHARALTVAQAASQPQGLETPPPSVASSGTAASAPGYASSPPAGAAPSNRDLGIWGVLPYSYGGFGYGLGVRVALPLSIPSLLPPGRIRDNWSLEFGADYVRFSLGYFSNDYSVSWFLPVAGVRWNVWLNDSFAVYPKVEAGYEIAWVSGYPSGNPTPSYGGIFVGGAAGLLYKVGSGNLTLRAEAGNFGVKGGIAFVF